MSPPTETLTGTLSSQPSPTTDVIDFFSATEIPLAVGSSTRITYAPYANNNKTTTPAYHYHAAHVIVQTISG
ncbi:hypothetical protein Tco_0143765 [Tanacetum coccineum]